MAKIYHNWLFDGIMIEPLSEDVGQTLDSFENIYNTLRDKKSKTAVERKIWNIAFHAYEKRGQSVERNMPSSILALCQYEAYAKKVKKWKLLESYGGADNLIVANNITDEEEKLLNDIINIVARFRKLWKIPPFKILQSALNQDEIDETMDYVGNNLLSSKTGLSRKIDMGFNIKKEDELW